MRSLILAIRLRISYIGLSPSGKATDFDSVTRGFESRQPSHIRPIRTLSLLFRDEYCWVWSLKNEETGEINSPRFLLSMPRCFFQRAFFIHTQAQRALLRGRWRKSADIRPHLFLLSFPGIFSNIPRELTVCICTYCLYHGVKTLALRRTL